jgi:hypothetical protein
VGARRLTESTAADATAARDFRLLASALVVLEREADCQTLERMKFTRHLTVPASARDEDHFISLGAVMSM